MSEIPPELLPAPRVLHVCVEPGCERLAYGARCQGHQTAEDHDRLHGLRVALLAAAEAEERWREARVRVLAAEREAGVRRRGESPT